MKRIVLILFLIASTSIWGACNRRIDVVEIAPVVKPAPKKVTPRRTLTPAQTPVVNAYDR